MLLVTRLKVPVSSVGGHRCIGIGHADLLGLAALPILLFDLYVILVEHLYYMTLDKTLPAHIGTN